ncbi:MULTISPECIES: hypothetical protein [Alteromonadaceae]|uniref:hypothetical protein n=1 Tax=Alteromonadaceae TaxID=72275 RepID=UPI001C084BCC|nr:MULTISPECIES: hypothetical protein [Aliiglaciecola]MBU2877370.1 hypothetical protein [Aliiglaciecola lipolytica]MDO6713018.1 hypothetical protein [Aliiglaciecola sp. 2_MG-2023]MDO6754057.1 hypothetical protein [Aliiglaciecola sp. 1_MG-2023]
MLNSHAIQKMIKTVGTCVCFVSLSACVSNDNPCEEVLEVKQQHQECERLRKTMLKTDYPQQALTAKIQYEEACVNLRYYRDEFDTICKKNETPIGQKPKQN